MLVLAMTIFDAGLRYLLLGMGFVLAVFALALILAGPNTLNFYEAGMERKHVWRVKGFYYSEIEEISYLTKPLTGDITYHITLTSGKKAVLAARYYCPVSRYRVDSEAFRDNMEYLINNLV